MSFNGMNYFTKENLDACMRALAKEYRKRNGRGTPAEIVLIGGASVLVNYGFRNMTADVDVVMHAASTMKDAINSVGDRYGLPNRWLNDDFMRTDSYSSRLDQYSVYYKTYSNILTVRTVTAEYLIAMKLRAGRKYKNDLSDIIGILAEHEQRGEPITADRIDTAVKNLYGGWENIPEDSMAYIRQVMRKGNYTEIYSSIVQEEQRIKDMLVAFEEDYPGTANMNNVNGIIENMKSKTASKTSILEQLWEKKRE